MMVGLVLGGSTHAAASMTTSSSQNRHARGASAHRNRTRACRTRYTRPFRCDWGINQMKKHDPAVFRPALAMETDPASWVKVFSSSSFQLGPPVTIPVRIAHLGREALGSAMKPVAVESRIGQMDEVAHPYSERPSNSSSFMVPSCVVISAKISLHPGIVPMEVPAARLSAL